MPLSISQLSLRHGARPGEVLIATIRLWVADKVALLAKAQAAFSSDVDNGIFFYLVREEWVSTMGRDC